MSVKSDGGKKIMTTVELQNKIEAKKAQIAKMEKNLVKYVDDAEFVKLCDEYFTNKNRSALEDYRKSHNLLFLPEYYSKRHDLEDAKATLAKYEKQLAAENDKQNTLSELPEAVVEFKNSLIKKWDEFDMWKLNKINEIINKLSIDYKERRETLTNMFGRGWRDFSYLKPEQIHNQNVKDAETLVLNMINRTIELTGKITDCKCLRLDYSNAGYSIINGIVIGEKGKAKIESIEAGGYNIQRLHIRVLVKEVK